MHNCGRRSNSSSRSEESARRSCLAKTRPPRDSWARRSRLSTPWPLTVRRWLGRLGLGLLGLLPRAWHGLSTVSSDLISARRLGGGAASSSWTLFDGGAFSTTMASRRASERARRDHGPDAQVSEKAHHPPRLQYRRTAAQLYGIGRATGRSTKSLVNSVAAVRLLARRRGAPRSSKPLSRRSTRCMRRASSRLWVAIRAATPVVLDRARSARRRRAPEVCGSRLPVGSSASSSRGALASARAIAVRCCSPPDSSAGR